MRRRSRILGDKKSNLREAKIITTLHKKGQASKQEIVENLYQGSASTENRAILGLIEEGLIEDAA